MTDLNPHDDVPGSGDQTRPAHLPADGPTVPGAPPHHPSAQANGAFTGRQLPYPPGTYPAAPYPPGSYPPGPYPPYAQLPMPGRGWKIAAPIAVVAAVVAVIVAILAGTGTFDDDSAGRGEPTTADATAAQEATQEVLTRTRSTVCLPFTYTAATLDDDAARAAAVLTGKAKQQFSETHESIRNIVLSSEASSRCVVEDLGLENLDGDTAQVLAVLLISTTSSKSPEQPQQASVQLILEKSNGTWLISEIETDGA